MLVKKLLRGDLAQDIIWLYCIHALNYLVPLLMIPYLARTLGVQAWGILSFTLSFAGFVSLITEYGFYVSGQREVARLRYDKHALAALFHEVLSAKLLLACVVILTSFVISRYIPAFQASLKLLLGALCFGMTQALSLAWYFRGLQRIKLAAGMEATAKGLSAVLVVLCIGTPADAWKYCYIFAISQLGVLVWGLWCVSREFSLRLPSCKEGIRGVRQAGAIFLLHAIGSLLPTSSVFILGLFASPLIVGYYAGAEKIIRFVASGIEPVRHAMFPRLSYLVHQSHHEARRQVQYVLRITGGLSVLLGSLIYIFAPQLMLLVLGEDFLPAIICLRVLVLLLPLSTLNATLGLLWMLPRGFERACLLIISAALCVDLLLGSFLVPTWQHIGMSVVLIISECCIFLGFWNAFTRD
ncbi:MAG: oligosaccharide flippase family protein [Candidatus Tectimicrobiota bacterium]